MTAQEEEAEGPRPRWLPPKPASAANLATGVAVAACVVGAVLAVVERDLHGQPPMAELLAQSTASGTLAVLGGLVARRRSSSPLGWLMLALGLETALTQFSYRFGLRYLLDPGVLPPAPESAASTLHLEDALSPSIAAVLFLLFPTGRPPSPRWRVVAFAIAAVAAVSVVTMLGISGQLADLPGVQNPFAVASLVDLARSIHNTTVPLLNLSFLVAGASLVARWRRATGVERQQVKWLATAAVVLAVLLVVGELAGRGVFGQALEPLSGAFFFGVLLVPTSVAIAVLRYRLHDIDVVISRALVFAVLAAFVTAVYVAVVVGVGSLLSSGGRPSAALSIAATAITAVAFQPVRDRARRLAVRAVYGHRSTPYEVLHELSERLGDLVEPDEQMALVARSLAQGLGGAATLWLRVGDEVRLAASSPSVDAQHAPVDLPTDGLPALGDVDRIVPVVHHGETLGFLTVVKPAGESLSALDDDLLVGAAGQVGLLLRNARLTAELYERLDQLRQSRERLVAAQDAERRRLERDLHDGAQQQLVGLRIRLNLARMTADDEHAPETSAAIGQLVDDAAEAIETLREPAHGIYPPLLAAQGIVHALRAKTSRSLVPVELVASELGRFDEAIEATIYFCVLEALQNSAKYAEATAVRVELAEGAGEIRFSVIDDGRGFDADAVVRGAGLQNMEDRVASVGGALSLISRPGEGATITGTIPVAASST
jgi:signal transduction histidine kinase